MELVLFWYRSQLQEQPLPEQATNIRGVTLTPRPPTAPLTCRAQQSPSPHSRGGTTWPGCS